MMIPLTIPLLAMSLAAATAAAPAAAPSTPPAAEAAGPAVGDPAPAFSLVGSDGKTYTLDQFKGKQAVVIAWFPKAFTGG